MAARVLGPEMEMEESEAESLLKASSAVADLYGYQPSAKATAWLALAGTVGMIYGPRFMALRIRLKMEQDAAKAEPPEPAGAPVIPFPHPGM